MPGICRRSLLLYTPPAHTPSRKPSRLPLAHITRVCVRCTEEAKAAGCRFRTGPELEITGYGCEDSFLEGDTFAHSWESLARLLSSDLTMGILVDVGMPILHKGVAYNCRVILLDRCVIGIRPKLFLANDGNYREMRWFTPWHVDTHAAGPHYAFGALQEFQLPAVVLDAVDSTRQPSSGTVPIGIFAVQAFDAAVGFETCEELFTPSELLMASPSPIFNLIEAVRKLRVP